jgi:hypothetical protein
VPLRRRPYHPVTVSPDRDVHLVGARFVSSSCPRRDDDPSCELQARPGKGIETSTARTPDIPATAGTSEEQSRRERLCKSFESPISRRVDRRPRGVDPNQSRVRVTVQAYEECARSFVNDQALCWCARCVWPEKDHSCLLSRRRDNASATAGSQDEDEEQSEAADHAHRPSIGGGFCALKASSAARPRILGQGAHLPVETGLPAASRSSRTTSAGTP